METGALLIYTRVKIENYVNEREFFMRIDVVARAKIRLFEIIGVEKSDHLPPLDSRQFVD